MTVTWTCRPIFARLSGFYPVSEYKAEQRVIVSRFKLHATRTRRLQIMPLTKWAKAVRHLPPCRCPVEVELRHRAGSLEARKRWRQKPRRFSRAPRRIAAPWRRDLTTRSDAQSAPEVASGLWNLHLGKGDLGLVCHQYCNSAPRWLTVARSRRTLLIQSIATKTNGPRLVGLLSLLTVRF